MLRYLHIENYALIRQSDIGFGPTFVAITGETGAGKSIMLGALGLLLGQRADVAVLADKAVKCVVEARFDIGELGLKSLFDEADVDYDDQLILRREILPSGKSRAFANDMPVQLPFLKAIGPHIIDIHSQHQTLTLGESGFRLSLLDAIAATPEPMNEYAEAYGEYSALKKSLEELTATEAKNRQEADYIQFQYDELCEARLEEGEQEALEQESALLAHAETVREGMGMAVGMIDDESESSVVSRLRQAWVAVGRTESYHPMAKELMERLESVRIEVDDICSELRGAAEEINYNAERQQEVDERLALIQRLIKKHSVETEKDLIALKEEYGKRLENISSIDERITELMEKVDKAYAAMQEKAAKLSEVRKEAGVELEEGILPVLKELGMGEARFCVRLGRAAAYGAAGNDTVEFLFNANKGGEMREMAKVASGGELSRLMLAIKSMLTTRTLLPTIIFDEIDTGVSGDISVAVGKIMKKMATGMQVVVITHLPQIAAKADMHLKVYKRIEEWGGEGHTVSHIKELREEERMREVAIMLSSDPPTEAALQTAAELMR